MKSTEKIVKVEDFYEYHRDRGNRVDTIRIDYYDASGEKEKNIAFSDGKMSSITSFITSKKQRTWSWRSEDMLDRSIVHTNRTTFTSFGEDETYYSTTVKNGDTTGRSFSKFFYDNNQRLIRRENYINGHITVFESYEYNGENMVRAEIHNVLNPVYYSRYDYIYDSNNLPLEKLSYIVRNKIPELSQHSKFEYLDLKLVSEKYNIGFDAAEETRYLYTYDNKNRLLNVEASKDTLYRTINYEFSSNYLSRIKVITNAWHDFSKVLLIPGLNSLLKKPIIYEKEFFYDENGNLIRVRETINGELYSSRVIKIDYRLQ